jgi:hypothetical protein
VGFDIGDRRADLKRRKTERRSRGPVGTQNVHFGRRRGTKEGSKLVELTLHPAHGFRRDSKGIGNRFGFEDHYVSRTGVRKVGDGAASTYLGGRSLALVRL